MWSRAWFHTYSKSDLLVNNLSECFNTYIMKAWDKPIVTMFEMIRKKLMRRYQLKRDGMRKHDHFLCPKILQKLDAIGLESCHCLPTYAGQGLFEVEHRHQQFVVDIQNRTCGCRKWDMTGIPCAHAFSTILYDGGKPEDYVHPYYSKDMYLLSYDSIIYPMPSEDQWVKTNNDVMEPLVVRTQPGRPKKLQIRAPDEPRNPHKLSRDGLRGRCTKCLQFGHNERTCPR